MTLLSFGDDITKKSRTGESRERVKEETIRETVTLSYRRHQQRITEGEEEEHLALEEVIGKRGGVSQLTKKVIGFLFGFLFSIQCVLHIHVYTINKHI